MTTSGPDRSHAGNVTALPGSERSLDPFTRRPAVLLEPPEHEVTFRVRVELDDVHPVVWRRLDLAGDLTLDRVHEVLQVAMGWGDRHLHAFVMGPGERDHGIAPFLTDFDVREGTEGVPERDVRLDQVLRLPDDCLYYDYDFGDGWEHRVLVEEVLLRDPKSPRASCTDGAHACPPEDVGGTPGYADLLAALGGGPADEWVRHQLDRLPDGFDPGAFDVVRTDEMVRSAVVEVFEDALSDETVDLLGRMTRNGQRTVRPWLATTTRRPLEFGSALPAALVAPWVALLDHVGDGLRLTGAGYLPPASVTHLVSVLDADGRVGPYADIMFGKGNREEHVQPVAWLRQSAQSIGLLRKKKGLLLPTAAGRACRADPERLLLHLADRLPLGRERHERDAGHLLLLATAAGVDLPDDQHASLVAAAGWLSDGAAPSRWAARGWSRPTSDVLHLAGWNPGAHGILVHDERASLLALLAVRARA